MSGECDKCGWHTLQCICGHPAGNSKFVMEWISVKDKLPEVGQHVVFPTKFYVNGTTVLRANAMGGIYTDKIDGKGRFTDLDMHLSYPEVTHWMPLPETPK